MSYDGFYRYIYKELDKYAIRKNNELFLTCNTLTEALYERDRFEKVGWDWDNYVQLPDTSNDYENIELPRFTKECNYISLDRECWVVRGHGKRQKNYGTFYTREEAETVAKLNDANIAHRREAYRIQKRINGTTKYYGRFKDYEDALARVKELQENNWVVE